MKQTWRCYALIAGIIAVSPAWSANLLEVYQQALTSDPTYQKAVSDELATNEGVAISRASLLPTAGLTLTPNANRMTTSGPGTAELGTDTNHGYQAVLTVTQTIFNYSQFANYAGAKSSAKAALATLNYASQDLMLRVATAYFAVLEDEDNLRASASNKKALAQQLDQVSAQYKVGLKTITDKYTAEASYQGAVADYISAENDLANAKENLRAITGVLYPSLAKLSERFPFITPQPQDINNWVQVALQQNWQVKADQYSLQAAKQNIQQQFAGHLPTLNVQGSYNINYTYDNGGSVRSINPPGAGKTKTSTVQLNLAIPIYSGGQVSAQTRQATDQYESTAQLLEQQVRQTENVARQSYLGVVAGISKVKADHQAIISAQSSLDGLREGYRVGTQTLVDVLNQQQILFTDQKQYAHDRYAYVNNLLALKEAAGTLSPDDLAGINAWLAYGDENL